MRQGDTDTQDSSLLFLKVSPPLLLLGWKGRRMARAIDQNSLTGTWLGGWDGSGGVGWAGVLALPHGVDRRERCTLRAGPLHTPIANMAQLVLWSQSNSQKAFFLWEKLRDCVRRASRTLEPKSYRALPNTILYRIGAGV